MGDPLFLASPEAFPSAKFNERPHYRLPPPLNAPKRRRSVAKSAPQRSLERNPRRPY